MNCSTSCPILVIFGSETPEFTLLTITPFAAIRQKSTCHAKYLRISWTYLDLIYGFGRRVDRDDYPDIRLAVAQGTLLWQLVKFGICSPTSQGTNFTLCFGVRQRTGQSYNDFKGLNDNNPATYVVYKFGKLQSNNLRVYAVKKRNFSRDLAAILRLSSLFTLSFRNGVVNHNFDFRKLIGNHFCTTCRNLVRYGSVTRSLRHKKLYSWRRNCFFSGVTRYIQ